jgi:hypothetical protein
VGAEVDAQFHEESTGAGSVVRADEVDVFERVIGLVVAREDDYAILLAGIAHDEVVHRHGADGSVGRGEVVGLEVAAGDLGREVCLDELLSFNVAGRAEETLRGGVDVLPGEGKGGLTVVMGDGLLGAGRGDRESKNK